MRWVALSGAFCVALGGAVVLWVRAVAPAPVEPLPAPAARALPSAGGGAVVVVPPLSLPRIVSHARPRRAGTTGSVALGRPVTLPSVSPVSRTVSPASGGTQSRTAKPATSPAHAKPRVAHPKPAPKPKPKPKPKPSGGPSVPPPPAPVPTPPTETPTGPVASPPTDDRTPAGSGPSCPAQPVTGAALTWGGNGATGSFGVAAGCPALQVSLGAYAVASSGAATLSASASGTFSAGGPFTLWAPLPSCLFRVELVTGVLPPTLGPDAFGGGELARVDGGVACPPPAPPPPGGQGDGDGHGGGNGHGHPEGDGSRPGWGHGDANHDHTGPPGHAGGQTP